MSPLPPAPPAEQGHTEQGHAWSGEDPPQAPPSWSMRRHLTAFSMALTLPLLAFVGFLLWQYAVSERTRLERDAMETARSLALAVDRELTSLVATLDVLSLSTYLQVGDLEAFQAQAAEVARRQGVFAVVRDLEGQQLVNLRRPSGTALPRTPLPVDAAALAARRPQVSGVQISGGQVPGGQAGAGSEPPLFEVVTPVVRGDQAVYLLGFGIEAERIRGLLAAEAPHRGQIASVVDGGNLILARTVRHEAFVGRSATAYLPEPMAGPQGTWEGVTLDGMPIFGAYARTRLADWRVAVGLSRTELDAPVRRSLLLFAGLGLLLTALTTGLAVPFGRRIAAPLRALAERAAALGEGAPVEALHTPIREVNRVGEALAGASVALREREAELRETNEEVQRFAYIVSHDLRAPLVNIMGFTSELEALRPALFGADRPAPDPETERDFNEALGFIRAGIAKMDGLIGAILRLSREGRRNLRPERLDMTALVRSLADAQRHQADAAGAAIEIAPLPPLTADRLAVEQVFGNLLDNAIKYLDPARPGRIKVSGQRDGASVKLRVEDNGRGIGTRDHARVFELFRRAGTQDRPGEGIGLAHVRTLVRALGGRIELASDLGAGTTVTVTLPEAPVREKAGQR